MNNKIIKVNDMYPEGVPEMGIVGKNMKIEKPTLEGLVTEFEKNNRMPFNVRCEEGVQLAGQIIFPSKDNAGVVIGARSKLSDVIFDKGHSSVCEGNIALVIGSDSMVSRVLFGIEAYEWAPQYVINIGSHTGLFSGMVTHGVSIGEWCDLHGIGVFNPFVKVENKVVFNFDLRNRLIGSFSKDNIFPRFDNQKEKLKEMDIFEDIDKDLLVFKFNYSSQDIGNLRTKEDFPPELADILYKFRNIRWDDHKLVISEGVVIKADTQIRAWHCEAERLNGNIKCMIPKDLFLGSIRGNDFLRIIENNIDVQGKGVTLANDSGSNVIVSGRW